MASDDNSVLDFIFGSGATLYADGAGKSLPSSSAKPSSSSAPTAASSSTSSSSSAPSTSLSASSSRSPSPPSSPASSSSSSSPLQSSSVGQQQSADAEGLALLRQLEVQAIKTGTIGYQRRNKAALDAAVEFLSAAIRVCPTYASAYNNRAQMYQLYPPDLASSESSTQPKLILALEDLNKAIELCTGMNEAAPSSTVSSSSSSHASEPTAAPPSPTPSSPSSSSSSSSSASGSSRTLASLPPVRLSLAALQTANSEKVLAQAYAQRAILHKLRAGALREKGGAAATAAAGEALAAERLSRADFARAAKLGNPFAKEEMVKMNPIAQLTSEVLPEILAQTHAQTNASANQQREGEKESESKGAEGNNANP